MSQVNRRQFLLSAGVYVAASLICGALMPATRAAEFPARPIRFIVPWGPGSGPDTTSRILAAELSNQLGQQVVIENRPGAGGSVGMTTIARAVPDGYTVGHGSIGTTISYSVIPRVTYDLNKDFQPIGQMLFGANVLAVRLSLPVGSVQELIAYAKDNPGKLLYGSPGNGSSLHVGMELFKLMTGTQMVHVPFRDAQQAITGLIGGQVDLQFENTGAIVPHIRAGRVRGLAVSSPQRSPALPELPTVAEAGVTGFEVVTWSGVVGPSGVPKDIVAKLNAELNRALAAPALKEKFSALGYEPVGGTPEQFDALIKKETLRWAEVVRRVGAKVD
jgi:tripartite-type tricarboxylate transporter receptor subunit TctC